MNRIASLSIAFALAACSQESAPAAEASSPATTAAQPAPGSPATGPVPASADTQATQSDGAEHDALVNRIWVRDTGAGDLPGAMLVFLSDGTLIQDSCWETYRLSEWTRAGDGKVSWNEDGMEIAADVVSVDNDDLTLRLNLTGGPEEQKFEAAEAPFVCPDMPR